MPIDSTLPEDNTTPENPSEAAGEMPPTEPTPAVEPIPEEISVPDAAAEGSAPNDVAAETALTPSAEPAAPKEALVELAARAEKSRLSPAEEARAAQTIKECLLDGRTGVALVVELLSKFAWMVAVNGVTAAWPELTSGLRTQFLSGLAKDESDAMRRLRLSVARGLFKQDVPAALKLAVGAAKDLRDKESGALGNKEAQMFANVFIGRAKPWLSGLPLSELKPGDADALVNCAVLAAFTLPHPPVTQLGVLKWAADAGRLEKLHPPALEAAKAGVARWNAKWQAALRKEVAGLPEEITGVLREPAATSPDASAALESTASDETDAAEPGDEEDAVSETPRAPRQYPVYVSKTIPPREAPVVQPEERTEAPAPAAARQSSRGGTSAANLNVGETLRLVEAHVAWLRGELKNAQGKLKDRESDRRTRRVERDKPIIEGEPTIEELARLNLQLGARIAELQQRIDDFTVDSEQRAASSGVITGQPVTEPEVALRALLALKLQEDYEDFLALEREANDIVVQAHYRTLLRHIFDVLLQEGVGLKESKSS